MKHWMAQYVLGCRGLLTCLEHKSSAVCVGVACRKRHLKDVLKERYIGHWSGAPYASKRALGTALFLRAALCGCQAVLFDRRRLKGSYLQASIIRAHRAVRSAPTRTYSTTTAAHRSVLSLTMRKRFCWSPLSTLPLWGNFLETTVTDWI